MIETGYDAVLVVSFGGPEQREEVIPFLENVLRGKRIPRERLLEVAAHYYHFGGRSPINEQTRELVAALGKLLAEQGPALPVYWGARHWRPLLPDVLARMARDGVRRAIAFAASAYSSHSSCRQYLDAIERARAEVGDSAPKVEKIRAFFNHPGFLEPMIENLRLALEDFPPERRDNVEILFTGHSIPLAAARASRYVEQLSEASRLVAEGVGRKQARLVYQSRSGAPGQPWLEPDIRDCLRAIRESGRTSDVVVVPIGFISDHMEVIYDLDCDAGGLSEKLGLKMRRAATVGARPEFVAMIRELILERTDPAREKRFLGALGPAADFCPADCCPPGKISKAVSRQV